MVKDQRETKPKDKAEIALEKAVFGDIEGFESGLRGLDLQDDDDPVSDPEEAASNDSGQEELGDVQDNNLFFIDEGDDGEIENEGQDEDGDAKMKDEEESDGSGSDAVWDDSDDEKLQISLTSVDKLRKLRKTMNDSSVDGREYMKRLRSRFQKIYPVPKWAKQQEEESDSDFDEGEDDTRPDPLAELLKKSTSYLSTAAPKTIPPTQISVTRLKDANHSSVSRSAIQTLNFHPTHPLMIASGYDRTLRLFHIDGKSNPVATTLYVKDSPFQTAQFHRDGRRVFAAGRRRYLYIWDIETGDVSKITRMYGHQETQKSMENFKLSPCGRYLALIGGRNGWMNVLSAATGQWICGAKVEGIIADFAWYSDGDSVIIANTNGDIWHWSVEQRQTVSTWKDEGGIGITTVSLSQDNRWFAIGSSNGMVNVYDLTNMKVAMEMPGSTTYKPVATLDQLVTTISTLAFSSDSQLLVMASRGKRDALRIAHVPSFTVYQNWPTSGTPLGRVTAASFTPGNEMLCTANEGGHARLWKLNHYSV